MADAEVGLQRIGAYIVTQLLNKGPTSSLYLGKQRKKDIAIKVFQTPLVTLEAKEAFLLRAKQLKKLKHRQVVEIHDFGFVQDADNDEGDLAYLVLQYLPGETLRQHVPPGRRIPADEVKRRLSPIASALHYAHVSGIMHGNLHPGNLLIISFFVGAAWAAGWLLRRRAEHARRVESESGSLAVKAVADERARIQLVSAFLGGWRAARVHFPIRRQYRGLRDARGRRCAEAAHHDGDPGA